MTSLLRIEAPDFLLTTDIAGHNGEGEYAIVQITTSQLQALRYLLTNAPTWTPEKPTKSGWYWVRLCDKNYKGEPRIVFIGEYNGLCVEHSGSEETDHLEYWPDDGFTAEWAGPLTPPEEEK